MAIGGISANIVAIILSAWSFKIRPYSFAIISDSFDEGNEIKESEIEDYEKMPREEFYNTMIWEYMQCIKENSGNNNYKSTVILPVQLLFMAGILIIPIL
jgi:hypothetical protein